MSQSLRPMNKIAPEITSLLNFLNTSSTAWHAVANCAITLTRNGFQELKEEDAWHLKAGGHYFVIRNGSSLCAFTVPLRQLTKAHICGSHTDSPGLKLKPNAEFIKENMIMLGLEVYGSPILGSWLNRDLGIAGKVVFIDTEGRLREDLVRITDTPVVIPQLAVHLDRNVNECGTPLNKQEHLAALAGVQTNKIKNSYLERTLKRSLPIKEILGFDLFLFPIETPRLIGEGHQLVAAYRIDSLDSVHACLEGFINTKKAEENTLKMVVFWDHEEIGSNTAQGAGSTFFPNVLERITLSLKFSREDYFRILRRSFCASIDLAHAFHPNYPEKHEPRHLTLLNKGIVIKSNAQKRYASEASSSAAIVALCHKHDIPYQTYVSRGDISCGSTIGPIHACLTGIQTVDIGSPQLSMHACREIVGVQDHLSMIELIKAFLNA